MTNAQRRREKRRNRARRKRKRMYTTWKSIELRVGGWGLFYVDSVGGVV